MAVMDVISLALGYNVKAIYLLHYHMHRAEPAKTYQLTEY